MKKFLSALIAMTMIISCVATVAFADVSGITGTLTKADLTESQQTTAGVGEGQVGYILKLNLSNFGTLTSDGDATGRKLQTLQLDLTFDHPENVVYMFGKSYKTPKPTGWKTKASSPFTKKTSSPHYSIPSNGDDATALYPKEEGEITSISSVYELYIVLTGDVVVSPVITGGIATFDDGDLDGDPENFENVALSTLALAGPSVSSTVDVTGVKLDKNELALKVGGTYDLKETVEPEGATNKNVTYSSNNTSVATVDANGVVTAVAKGTATITVTTEDGSFTDTCAVTVSPADVVPASTDSKIIGSTTDGLKDASGEKVTIDPSRSYGAAKFENVQVDDGEYVYKVVATGTNNSTSEVEERVFDIDDELEISGTASFIAIVKGVTHTITSVVLKAFKKLD